MHKAGSRHNREKLEHLDLDFPLPEDKVVLLDLDGTCIDSDYKVHEKNLFVESIESIQGLGWEVGISSDTPLSVIADWSVEFGASGPNIAEKGSVVEVDGCSYYDRAKSEFFNNVRDNIESHFQNSDMIVWSGDPVQFIRQNETIGQPGDEVVLVNNHRLCSLGVFARKVAHDQTLIIDNELTDNVIDEARMHYSEIIGLEEDINHDQGLLIVSEKDAEKRKGTMQLQAIKSISRIAMVGNSMSDYLGEDIAVHYAVGNSDEDFKTIADYTAELPLALGVIEILNKLSDTES